MLVSMPIKNEGAAATSPATNPDANALDRLLYALGRARQEIAKCVVGHAAVIDELLIALICEGHVLLQGAPGVGKTLLVRTLGAATGLSFARIQFTPDLMPADITGTMVLVPQQTGHSQIKFQAGPI